MVTFDPELSRNPSELINAAYSLVLEGLSSSFQKHEELGEAGTEEVSINKFGEGAMRGDVEAEDVLIDVLRSSGRHIRVLSEEHGEFELNPNDSPVSLLAVMDGLDGSSVYKKERGVGRYGTMLALLEGPDPTYADYLVAGVMEHSTKRLILAKRGEGVTTIDMETGTVTHAKSKSSEQLNSSSLIYVDGYDAVEGKPLYEYFIKNQKYFRDPFTDSGFQVTPHGSTAAKFVSIATGEADLAGESTRKGNLEFATAYALLHEAGGVMLTMDGTGIGSKHFLTFGQSEHIPILGASNMQIAEQAIHLINR